MVSIDDDVQEVYHNVEFPDGWEGEAEKPSRINTLRILKNSNIVIIYSKIYKELVNLTKTITKMLRKSPFFYLLVYITSR